ncbi:MAG: hypothetical protein K2G18_02210 [Bacteroidales bacterium]|nr:hypothetical protein [Bacteroidales bacterium]
MKQLYKILYGMAVCLSVLAAGSCSKETVYIYPETGISRLTVSPRNVDMGYADEVVFTVAVRPGNTEYVWESSDPSVAYVDENDRIVPVGTGTVTFTCSAGEYRQTVEVVVRPSVVVSRDYIYIDKGQSSAMDFVQVLPEGTAYTVTSADENVVSVPEASKLGFSAVGAGVAEVTVEIGSGADEPISGSFTVAVADAANVISASASDEYFYDGATLGHPVYGISALALSSTGVTYADGGQWSGTGTGVFLKLYNPDRGNGFAAVPAGKYTAGESVNNFFAANSYIIDVESGTKTAISAGEIEISDNAVTGYVTAGSDVYKVNCSGARTGKKHSYAYDRRSFSYTAADFTLTNTVTIDHNGTVFYGGVTNVWRWKMTLPDSEYLQLVFCTVDTDNPLGTYPVSGAFFAPGTCVGMGWGTTSMLRENGTDYQISAGEVVVDNYVYASPASVGFHGEFSGSVSDAISEIGESRTIPFSVAVDIESLSFTLNEY